jgi:hypothetical protein
MPVSNQDILKTILLQELDRMEPETSTFEDDPMQFILKKYAGLKNTLEYLMTPSFEEYITGIYVVAPKPTTFKVVLHNGQFLFLQFMGKAYEATVEGRKYYLMSIGEKERCMIAISRLLRFGNPLKTKGPDGAEQATRDSEGPSEEAGPTPPAETSAPEAGGEELTESRILESILTNYVLEAEGEQKKSVLFETALVIAWHKINNRKIPKGAVSDSEVNQINSKYPDLINKAKKALIATNLTGGEYAISTGKLSEPLTEFWSFYKAKNKTSKSDVIIGGARISVKAGPSQLMSGVKEEAKATFYAALEKTPELIQTEEVQNILKQINKFAKGGRTQGNIRTSLKTGEDKALNTANAANKKAMAALESLFENNPTFTKAFVIEAMSGEKKFGADSPATAEYILSVDKNYENAKLVKIKNDSYAKKVAGQIKVDVRFKTGSIKSKGEKTGEYGYATVLGLQYNPEDINEIDSSSIKNFFSSAWNKLKSSLSSLLNFFIGDPENVDVDVEGEDLVDFS